MSLIFQILKTIILLTLPFLLLLKGAIYIHVHYAFSPWVCILLGILLTTLILFVYFSFAYGKISGRFGGEDVIKRRAMIALIVVLAYCGHGIFYLSGNHFKNTALKKEISKIHPILRLSVSTLSHLDKNLIITDTNRLPEDYKKMGLKTKKHSLHYKQSSGYSHALDLRTKNRSEFKNKLVEYYFWSLGLNTLRHHGTADHLHISLMSHDRPGGK